MKLQIAKGSKEALKKKSRERREEFRKFKEQSRQRRPRDAKEKMHRGPDIDFVHGSKMGGNISAQISPPENGTGEVEIGYEFAPPRGDEGVNPYADGLAKGQGAGLGMQLLELIIHPYRQRTISISTRMVLMN